jgi:hypothetical protein
MTRVNPRTKTCERFSPGVATAEQGAPGSSRAGGRAAAWGRQPRARTEREGQARTEAARPKRAREASEKRRKRSGAPRGAKRIKGKAKELRVSCVRCQAGRGAGHHLVSSGEGRVCGRPSPWCRVSLRYTSPLFQGPCHRPFARNSARSTTSRRSATTRPVQGRGQLAQRCTSCLNRVGGVCWHAIFTPAGSRRCLAPASVGRDAKGHCPPAFARRVTLLIRHRPLAG